MEEGKERDGVSMSDEGWGCLVFPSCQPAHFPIVDPSNTAQRTCRCRSEFRERACLTGRPICLLPSSGPDRRSMAVIRQDCRCHDLFPTIWEEKRVKNKNKIYRIVSPVRKASLQNTLPLPTDLSEARETAQFLAQNYCCPLRALSDQLSAKLSMDKDQNLQGTVQSDSIPAFA